MIEQIISSLKGEMMQKFTGGEQSIPKEKVDDAVVLAKDNMLGTVKDEVQRGNINGLMGLLDNKQNVSSNPIASNMIMKYAGDLGSKLGISPSMATTIANFAIPFILKKLTGTAQAQGMNQASIMGMLGGLGGSGGAAGNDVGDMLKGKFGDSLGGLFK